MKKVLCYLLVTTSCFAFAKKSTPLLQSMKASDSSYYSYLSLHTHKYISYVDFKLTELNNNKINEYIRKLYLMGQNKYFEKQFYQAKIHFLELVGLYNQHQLNSHSQKLVLNSLKKLTELTAEPQQINEYNKLIEGGAFPQLSLKQNSTDFWDVPQHFAGFNKLVLNGSIYDIYPGHRIYLPANEFIVSLVSNKFKSVTKKLTKSDLKLWLPNKTWLITGDCNYTKAHTQKLKQTVFFNSDCIVSPNYKKSQQKINLEQLVMNNKEAPLLFANHIKIKKKSWYKNKWIWLATAAITTAVIISTKDNNTSDAKPQKTIKNGF